MDSKIRRMIGSLANILAPVSSVPLAHLTRLLVNIATSESSGNPHAHGPGNELGLFQITPANIRVLESRGQFTYIPGNLLSELTLAVYFFTDLLETAEGLGESSDLWGNVAAALQLPPSQVPSQLGRRMAVIVAFHRGGPSFKSYSQRTADDIVNRLLDYHIMR